MPTRNWQRCFKLGGPAGKGSFMSPLVWADPCTLSLSLSESREDLGILRPPTFLGLSTYPLS